MTSYVMFIKTVEYLHFKLSVEFFLDSTSDLHSQGSRLRLAILTENFHGLLLSVVATAGLVH